MFQIKSVNTFGDVDAVIRLLRQLAEYEKMEADFNPSTDRLRIQLSSNANPALQISLAYDSSDAVGIVIFYEGDYSSFHSGWRVYLEDIFVAESHRGQGLSRQLLKPVARRALNCEIKEIAFSVLDWNKDAIATYRHLGAVTTGYKVAEDGAKWLTMAFRGEALYALT